MPKDFMCSRITDNSPIRFLDCDMSDKINLYRPKIPYVLQTLFDNGSWRTRRLYQQDSEGNTLRGKIRNPPHSNHYECWKGDWNNFVKSNQLLDLLTAYWKYNGDNRVFASQLAKGIACPPPQIKVYIGDRTISTPITTPIRIGTKGNQRSQNYSHDVVRRQIGDLERKLDNSKYNNLLIKGDGVYRQHRNTTPDKLISCKYYFISNEIHKNQNYMSDTTRKKWERRHIKEQGKDYKWECSGVNWDVPPLSPNIYQNKKEIVEYIKRRYFIEDIKIQKLTKKYTAKQLVKMYWKDIIDCF